MLDQIIFNSYGDFRKVEIIRRDWNRIILDLHAVGMSDVSIAKAQRLGESTIRNWKYGAEPVHSNGEALLALHAYRLELFKQEQRRAHRTVYERRRRALKVA